MRNREALVDLMKHFVRIGPAGCALTISQGGKVLFEHYEGLADIERGAPITRDTVYRMFSSTKPITIAAAMILFERGKLLLTDPLEKYLPFFRDAKCYRYWGSNAMTVEACARPITIKSLMTMTSGIPYGNVNTRTQRELGALGATSNVGHVSLMDFMRSLSAIPLQFQPGAHWNYGFGCDVIGAVIEVVSGKRFGAFLQEELFAPLGMERTAFVLRDDMLPHLAGLYERSAEGSLARNDGYDCAYAPDWLYESGGAGLVSTLGDMTRFSQMMAMGGIFEGKRLLCERTVRLIGANHLDASQSADFEAVANGIWPNMIGYGFGLGCRTLTDPAAAGSISSVGEFGWSGAAGTWTLIDPELQLSAEYAQQLFPSSKNLQEYCHPRLRNAIYAAVL